MRVRIVLLLLVLFAFTAPSSARAVVVTPAATSADQACAGIEEYIDARKAHMDTWQKDIAAALGIENPSSGQITSEDSSDEISALLTLPEDDLRAISESYSQAADDLEQMSVPQIVEAYHDITIQRFRAAANLFKDASTVGVLTALLSYGTTLTDLVNKAVTAEQFITARCSGFARILTIDTELVSEGTPEAG